RQLCGPRFALERVTFRHGAPATVASHRAFFGCRVEFGEADDGFSFSRRLLEIAPPLANTALAAYLQEQAERQLRTFERSSVTAALRSLLDRELRGGEPNLGAARSARALGVSE